MAYQLANAPVLLLVQLTLRPVRHKFGEFKPTILQWPKSAFIRCCQWRAYSEISPLISFSLILRVGSIERSFRANPSSWLTKRHRISSCLVVGSESAKERNQVQISFRLSLAHSSIPSRIKYVLRLLKAVSSNSFARSRLDKTAWPLNVDMFSK